MGVPTTNPSACVTIPREDTSTTGPTRRLAATVSVCPLLRPAGSGRYAISLAVAFAPIRFLGSATALLGASRDEAFRREVPAPRDQGPRAHGALGRLPSPLFAHGRVVVCALPVCIPRTRVISFDK